MLDDHAIKLAVARVDVDLRERQSVFAEEVAGIKEHSRARGGLHSSGARELIHKAIGREYEIRAMQVWHILVRVVSGATVKAEPGVSAQLKSFVHEQVSRFEDDLSRSHRDANLMAGHSVLSLDELRDRPFKKVDSEIDIAIASASRASKPAEAGATLNFYSPVGVVQTGPNAIASVTQIIGPEVLRAVQEAMGAVKKAVTTSADLADEQRSQILEVVQDVISESKRSSPNPMRVRSALIGIATTIQTLASAKGAYEMVKSAAALMGICLPGLRARTI